MAATGSSSAPCHVVTACKSRLVQFVHMVSMPLSLTHIARRPPSLFLKIFLCFNSCHAWITAQARALDTCHARMPARDGGPNKLQGCSTAFCLLRVLARQLGQRQHLNQPARATHHPAGRDQRPPFLARLDRAVTPMDCDSALFPVVFPAQ